MFSCLCKHLGIQVCQQDPVTIVDDILVATDGRELCLLVRLVQRAGKWFSLSLALGTDVVADILTCYSLTCLAIMTVQDVTAPIKKTTWWAHNPQFHRIET